MTPALRAHALNCRAAEQAAEMERLSEEVARLRAKETRFWRAYERAAWAGAPVPARYYEARWLEAREALREGVERMLALGAEGADG